MFITWGGRGAISRVFARVFCQKHTHTHFPFPCVIPSLSAVFSGAFVGDVKAVIGQVSGVELSDNRLVTAAAHE